MRFQNYSKFVFFVSTFWYLWTIVVFNPFSFGRVSLVSSCTKSAVFQLWGRLERRRDARRRRKNFQKPKLLDMSWCACGQLQRRCVDRVRTRIVATYSAGAGMHVRVPVRTVRQNDVMTPVPGMGRLWRHDLRGRRDVMRMADSEWAVFCLRICILKFYNYYYFYVSKSNFIT